MLQAAMFDILISRGRDETRTIMFAVVNNMSALKSDTEVRTHKIFESVFGMRPMDMDVKVENGNVRCKMCSVSVGKNSVYIHSFLLSDEETKSMFNATDILKGGAGGTRARLLRIPK